MRYSRGWWGSIVRQTCFMCTSSGECNSSVYYDGWCCHGTLPSLSCISCLSSAALCKVKNIYKIIIPWSSGYTYSQAGLSGCQSVSQSTTLVHIINMDYHEPLNRLSWSPEDESCFGDPDCSRSATNNVTFWFLSEKSWQLFDGLQWHLVKTFMVPRGWILVILTHWLFLLRNQQVKVFTFPVLTSTTSKVDWHKALYRHSLFPNYVPNDFGDGLILSLVPTQRFTFVGFNWSHVSWCRYSYPPVIHCNSFQHHYLIKIFMCATLWFTTQYLQN